MNSDQIQSLIRTVLVTIGGSLVASGKITDPQLTQFAGAVAILGSLAWSLWSKRESARLAAAVQVVNASPHTTGDANRGTVTINSPA